MIPAIFLVSFFAFAMSAALGALWCWRNHKFNGESEMLKRLAMRDLALAYFCVSLLVAGALDTPGPKQTHTWPHTAVILQATVVLAVAAVAWVLFLVTGGTKKH